MKISQEYINQFHGLTEHRSKDDSRVFNRTMRNYDIHELIQELEENEIEDELGDVS